MDADARPDGLLCRLMYEYSSVSASSYDPGALVAKLNEAAADGWDVVAIVPTGGDVSAFLRRSAGGRARRGHRRRGAPGGGDRGRGGHRRRGGHRGGRGRVAAEEAFVADEIAVEAELEERPTRSPVSGRSPTKPRRSPLARGQPTAPPRPPSERPSPLERSRSPRWPRSPRSPSRWRSRPAGRPLRPLPRQPPTRQRTSRRTPPTRSPRPRRPQPRTSRSSPPAPPPPWPSRRPAPAPAPEPAAGTGRRGVVDAAGWYPDPSTRYELRYWDGTQWTEHVARQGQQFTDPPVR